MAIQLHWFLFHVYNSWIYLLLFAFIVRPCDYSSFYVNINSTLKATGPPTCATIHLSQKKCVLVVWERVNQIWGDSTFQRHLNRLKWLSATTKELMYCHDPDSFSYQWQNYYTSNLLTRFKCLHSGGQCCDPSNNDALVQFELGLSWK